MRDLDEAVERFTKLFGLKVHHCSESKDFGFKNAILPTGIGHIELMQPTDPDKAVGKFLAKNGEGVYLVGFECKDIPGAVTKLRGDGVRADSPREAIALGCIRGPRTGCSSSSVIANGTTRRTRQWPWTFRTAGGSRAKWRS